MLKNYLVVNVILNANFEISNQKINYKHTGLSIDFKENSIMFPIRAWVPSVYPCSDLLKDVMV